MLKSAVLTLLLAPTAIVSRSAEEEIKADMAQLHKLFARIQTDHEERINEIQLIAAAEIRDLQTKMHIQQNKHEVVVKEIWERIREDAAQCLEWLPPDGHPSFGPVTPTKEGKK